MLDIPNTTVRPLPDTARSAGRRTAITVRMIHRCMAAVVGVFVSAHLANHLALLKGVAAHIDVMAQLRTVYRQPAVEAMLLACVALQAASGIWLLRAGWRKRPGLVPRVQAASGAYLALFLLVHVSAILLGRAVHGLDTNVHFAAAGLHVWPFQYFFAPYYFLAVVALFTHLGCAMSWHVRPSRRRLAVALPTGVGVVVATIIVAALMGTMYPYEVPERYRDTYRMQPAV